MRRDLENRIKELEEQLENAQEYSRNNGTYWRGEVNRIKSKAEEEKEVIADFIRRLVKHL